MLSTILFLSFSLLIVVTAVAMMYYSSGENEDPECDTECHVCEHQKVCPYRKKNI